MDTKSRSIKPGLAFLAFVLGVTLLLYSGAAWLYLCTSGWSDTYGYYLSDIFQSDYQQTVSFRSMIGNKLTSLLHYALIPEDYSYFPLEAEDANLLYTLEKDGELLSSNTSYALTSLEQIPDGYNFLLYFDGETVSIWKDGQELDVYGDGSYRGVEEDWPVPGYQNGATPASYAAITVRIAVSAEPIQLTYSYGPWSVAHDLSTARICLIWLLFVPPVAGVALLALSIIWRRYKLRADQAIAWFTGHIWLELKLLLVAPLVYLLAFAVVALAGLFFYSDFDWVLKLISVPIALWWSYFYLNDLRWNFGQLSTHSFCAACARLLGRQELRWSVQRRMDRRSVLQFALSLPFVLLAAFQIPYLYDRYFYYSLWPLILVLFCLIGAALVAAQIWLLRRNRRATADMDKLLFHIRAAGEGQATAALVLPEDSDLRGAAASLSHVEDGLRSALEEQMKSERTKIELIANVSHDLKTPLTSIVSYVELLGQEEDLPEHVRDYIRILADKSKRLQTMVRDVFEVSKAAAGSLPVAVKPLDYAKLLRQTMADMNEAIEASPAPLRAQLPEEPVWIEADGDRLYRVFQNLIGNALKYALENSRIYLDLTVTGNRACAVLRNISRDELPQGVDLTERFVRGDASRTDSGSGLGLSIARTFTEACGGSFSLDIDADLFTVRVSFPLTARRPPEEPALQEPPAP